MSSERRGGRAPTDQEAIDAALRAGRRALERIADDTLETYLANEERQEAIERLLLRFGEALKAVAPPTLKQVDPAVEWDKPIRFRDLVAHWYEEGLDHQLIWNVLKFDLPPLLDALERHLKQL